MIPLAYDTLRYFADACPSGEFFGLKSWHAYLPKNGDCSINLELAPKNGVPANWNQLWTIGLVIFEDLLRVAAIAAVGFIIWGGIKYIMSRGEPDNTQQALSTIKNAVIGLAITTIGAVVVSFIGTKLGG